MGFRFWRRIKILPGVTLNLSKSGGSISFGPRGAKFTIGPSGKRVSVGIPGTGLFYTTKLSNKEQTTTHQDSISGAAPEDRLTLGFFKRLITPDDEKALVNGLKELVLGNENNALEYFKKAVHLADGAFFAGFLFLKKGDFWNAINYLQIASEKHKNLGHYISKYGVNVTLTLLITEEIFARIYPNFEGVLLCLVEAYQRLELWKEAIECLEKLLEIAPEDIVVKLSLAELLFEAYPDDKDVLQRIVKIASDIDNDTSIHTALLLYKAKALHKLGLFKPAKDILTSLLRRKKGRPDELLLAIRYQRALVYLDLGHLKRSKEDLQKIYAECPDYEDVASRLGL